MRLSHRSRRIILSTATLLGSAALVGVPAVAATARTLNATDEAHLHLVNAYGELLIEEGAASGALPGTVRVRFNVSANITGSFTINTHNGSISGHGSATLHSTSTYASFAGTLTVTHGTGRYTHAHGTGGLYGTVNRHSDAIVIQTTGRLSY